MHLPRLTSTHARTHVNIAPLSETDREEAQGILKYGADEDVVVSAFNVNMLRQHVRTLRPGTWLNDEVGWVG